MLCKSVPICFAVMPPKTSKRASGERRPQALRRTTVALPNDLLNAVDRAVRAGKARSRAELLIRALQRELYAERRAEIDAAFLEMANDPDYQREALRITEEFRFADWEALQQGQRQP